MMHSRQCQPVQTPPVSMVRSMAIAVAEELQRSNAPGSWSPYMTVPEASAYMRCKPQRLYDLISRGLLRRYKDGLRVLLRREDLDAYLAAFGDAAPRPRCAKRRA
jgi:excisionase family DNA binding protein